MIGKNHHSEDLFDTIQSWKIAPFYQHYHTTPKKYTCQKKLHLQKHTSPSLPLGLQVKPPTPPKTNNNSKHPPPTTKTTSPQQKHGVWGPHHAEQLLTWHNRGFLHGALTSALPVEARNLSFRWSGSLANPGRERSFFRMWANPEKHPWIEPCI